MQDKDETTTKCKISELYVSNDMEAFQIDRHLTIQRKLQAKDPTNKEVVKNLANELKLHQHDSLAKIILTNSQNTYPFSDDAISTAISTEIFEVLEIEAESEEISINRLGRAGPFVVALRGDFAHTLLSDGSIDITDWKANPPITQGFTIKKYVEPSASTSKSNTTEKNKDESSNPNEDTGSTMDFSIFFNLPVEYTGLLDKKQELDFPKKMIDENLKIVFANPDIHYKIIQPRTEMGFYRNALRVIVTMPRFKQAPSDLDVLSQLKYIAMKTGARPATATMSQETRALFGVSNCCFRSTCKEDQGCEFREQRWKELGYEKKRPNQRAPPTKKRDREEEHKAKRQEAMQAIRQLRMEKRQKAMCRMYLEGKCDKKRYECQKGEHGSAVLSKTIICASAKEGANWICRMGDMCPYACHLNPE